MSRNSRRTLAVAVLSALSLALPPPSKAASLWTWQPPDLAARVWSWLQDLGLIPQAEKPSGGLEKEGSMIEPDGRKAPVSAPVNSDEGSMIEPDGHK